MARKAEPIPASDTIGNRLRCLREENDMTLTELADEFECRPQTIRTWERNQYNPGIHFIILYSELFGVSTDWILKGGDYEG